MTESDRAANPTTTPGRDAGRPWYWGLRRRFLAGVLLALPVVVTAWVLFWAYSVIDAWVVRPLAGVVVALTAGNGGGEPPASFVDYLAPALGVTSLCVLVYGLGCVAHWKAVGLAERLLARVPVVSTVYRTARGVFRTLGGQGDWSRFNRVVLVAFPHPGMKVPGFVTGSCRDVATGGTILCVYVPTTPIPTSGYMLLVPEQDVTDLDWTLEEALQAVVSFGLTAPPHVRYSGVGEEDRSGGADPTVPSADPCGSRNGPTPAPESSRSGT
jgi:uncharacterized membrane protein